MAFKWIAAGTSYEGFGNISAYVRFRHREGPYEETRYPIGTLCKLKDREVFFVKPGAKDYNLYFPLTNFDYCVDADLLLKDSAIKHTGVMLAYEDSNSKRSHKYDKSKLDFMLMADSGGFQILSGVRSFVDPKDLAKFCNQYATHAMTLDIPTRAGIDVSLVKKSAKIQKLNTNILLKNLNKDIVLYNVSHGSTPNNRRKFIDAVYDDRLDSWAIGGAYYGNLFDKLCHLLTVIDHTKAKNFHLLGTANTKTIILIAWLGKYIDVTSDSSSHIQSGKCNSLFTIMERRFKKLAIGGRRDFQLQSDEVHPQLPACGSFLGTVDTTEIFQKAERGNTCHFLTILHDIHAMANYTEIWNDLAKKSTLKQYKELMKRTIPSNEYHTFSSALDYIECTFDVGVDKATKRFTPYITIFHKNNDLGKGFLAQQKTDAENVAVDNMSKDSLNVRVDKALKLFEMYHAGKSVTDNAKGRRVLEITGSKIK